MSRGLADLLARRELPALLAGLALLLTLPALAVGRQWDDHDQHALLGARPGLAGLGPATTDLFRFLSGDPAEAAARVAAGALPWWTLPTAQTAFWRPLSGLTHWLDYQLWPGSPALMHLHSLLWLAGLAAAAGLLYRRLLGPTPLAGLAGLLYALDDARGLGAAWLANRNALCAALLGLLAIMAHRRWRETGRRRDLALALLWLAAGLLAAEAAVAALAFLAADALWLDRGGWRRRLAGLLPALALVAGWRALYRGLGYGAWGTTYLDPLREPLAYLGALAWRGPLLLLGQWGPLPAELAPLLPPAAGRALWLAALALLAGLAWLLAPLLREDRQARFWATGMLLAALPPCAALPANRLLLFVGLGACGLLARLLARPPAADPRRARLARWLLALQLLGPPLLPLAAYSPAMLGEVGPALASLPSDPAVAGRELVVVAAPSPLDLAPLGQLRAAAGLPAPARSLLLASGPGGAWLARPDRRTLVVRPDDGYLLGFAGLFRAPWHPLGPGEQVRLPGLTVTVLELTADGRPAAAAFRFDTPLESGGRLWYVWRGGRYLPLAPPPPGGALRVAPLLLPPP